MPSPDDSCAVWTSSLHLRRCSPGLLCCRSRCGKLQAWNVGHAVLDIGPAVLNICLCSPAMSDQQSWTFRPAVLDVCLCGPAMSDLQSCNVGPAVLQCRTCSREPLGPAVLDICLLQHSGLEKRHVQIRSNMVQDSKSVVRSAAEKSRTASPLQQHSRCQTQKSTKGL